MGFPRVHPPRLRGARLIPSILWIAASLAASAGGRPLPSVQPAADSGSATGRAGDRIYAILPPYAVRHDIGQLHMQVSNLGVVGNPWGNEDPGAAWQGGEHLYAAGLWIAAIPSDNLPHVSTGAFEHELRPSLDLVDRMYLSHEGMPGGNREGVSPQPDDDVDGRTDEDFCDGLDNDIDGRTDEDFSAVSEQMYSCRYWDYTPEAVQAYPEHHPLHVLVRQRSLAWSRPGDDSYIPVEYEIINDGYEVLRDVYLGLFVDGDIGPLGGTGIYRDDGGFYAAIDTALIDVTLPECDTLRVRTSLAYMYDVPDSCAPSPGGDGGGFFGVLVLDHTVDPFGETAPLRPEVSTIRFMQGSLVFPAGDPVNDAERYDAMSCGTLPQRPTSMPDDYRYLVAVGPFAELPPGQGLRLVVGFVAGKGYFDPATGRPDPTRGPDGMPSDSSLVANALRAWVSYHWQWMDIDGLPDTGIDGRETCLTVPPGSPPRVWHDPCDSLHTVRVDWNACDGPFAWVDNDCDPCTPNPVHAGCDLGGCETLIHWKPPEPMSVGTDGEGGAQVVAGANLSIRSARSPSGPPVTILLDASAGAQGELWVHDLLGRRLRRLGGPNWAAGRHEIAWDGRDATGRRAASGVYFVRFGSGPRAISRTVFLVRLDG